MSRAAPRARIYYWVHVTGQDGSDLPEVGLSPARGEGPLVDLRFSSLASAEEMVNTLRGHINAVKRIRAERRAARRKGTR